ncbi:protein rhomboid [Aethina tumida]|uniref:protein rhomboid n=1 Tax=Aethina tumida TaxID=116153 RepID=UPI00096B6588|nr:protein rhomboid [Aethina tumida]XP_019881811.1 protein rhomboid [Aethina tumida]XP_019881812.1 protein rhomboid [Aethina tumida]
MNGLPPLGREQNVCLPISPATTPGASSTVDDEHLLVPLPIQRRNRKKWKDFTKKWKIPLKDFPWPILTTSILQILFHVISNEDFRKQLRFEPKKQTEVWRFVTYMLVHDDWYHLIFNILMQCLFATFLERRQGRLSVMSVYVVGGMTGVLGASCVHPDLVIGASAGVYALLMSNLADIMLNLETIKYKFIRIVYIVIIVVSDIIYNVIHFYSKDEPLISWGAHIVGGITGVLVGLILFKRNKEEDERLKRRNRIFFWCGVILYCFLFLFLILLSIQIKKCTPKNTYQKYVYFC